MTAADVIEQIRTLAPSERAKVLNVLLEIESTQPISEMDDRTFDEAMDVVLEQHAELMRKLAQ